jgi:glucose/arabinose dehydrogenase
MNRTRHRIPLVLLIASVACSKTVHVPGPADDAGQSAPHPAFAAPAVPTGGDPAPAAAPPGAGTPEGPSPVAPAVPAASRNPAQRAALARPAGCPAGVPPLKLTLVASGFTEPTYVTSPPHDPSTLFVLEKAGVIKIVRAGAVQPDAFLDLKDRVWFPAPNAEGGLLGLAFHPEYEKNGRFWVHYSSPPRGNVVIAEHRRSPDRPDRGDPRQVRALVEAKHSAWNHVGGMLAFGPDGYLYAAIGDGATTPSPAPDLRSRLGKILRIDVDNPQKPPPGNVSGGDPLIWDYGLRNPWRFSFDRLTGDLYIGDVGQKTWEEILVEPAGKGRNDYGWDRMEGSQCYPIGSTCTPRGVPPAVAHARGEAGSITGGYVYRGAKIPCLRGRYIYGDYVTARYFSFVWDGKAAADRVELTKDLGVNGLPASFGEDAAGEIYAVMFNTGRIYRFDPR